MWNDYEYYYEPSEADEILNEYADKMKTVLCQRIKNEIADVDRQKQIYEKTIEKYNEMQRQLEQERKDFEKQKLEFEKGNLPREYLNKIIDEFNCKYHLGEEVFIILNENVKKKCPLCGGDKKLTVTKDNLKFDIECPKCKGNDYYEYARVYHKGKIQNVSFEINIKDRLTISTLRDDYDYNTSSGFSCDVIYDYNKTRSYVRYSDIFTTEEAAMMECKKRNNGDK